MRFVIHGTPVSQKNRKRWGGTKRTKAGKTIPVVRDAPEVARWRASAALQLSAQKPAAPLEPETKHGLIVVAYLAHGQRMDGDAVLAAPMDALEGAGIIANDHWFEPVASMRRRDATDPRIEIYIGDSDRMTRILEGEKDR